MLEYESKHARPYAHTGEAHAHRNHKHVSPHSLSPLFNALYFFLPLSISLSPRCCAVSVVANYTTGSQKSVWPNSIHLLAAKYKYPLPLLAPADRTMNRSIQMRIYAVHAMERAIYQFGNDPDQGTRRRNRFMSGRKWIKLENSADNSAHTHKQPSVLDSEMSEDVNLIIIYVPRVYIFPKLADPKRSPHYNLTA